MQEWFAVRVKSRYEKVSSALLAAKKFETLLPLYRRRPRGPQSSVSFDLPLFPGYVFCRFDVSRRLPILVTPGVLHIVGVGKTPMAVNPDEMESVRRIAESGLLVERCPYIEAGDLVRVEGGPLAGVTGKVISFDKKRRLVVSIEILKRSVSVVLDGCDVVSVKSVRRPAGAGEMFRAHTQVRPRNKLLEWS